MGMDMSIRTMADRDLLRSRGNHLSEIIVNRDIEAGKATFISSYERLS
jgi:hypothetical protein